MVFWMEIDLRPQLNLEKWGDIPIKCWGYFISQTRPYLSPLIFEMRRQWRMGNDLYETCFTLDLWLEKLIKKRS